MMCSSNGKIPAGSTVIKLTQDGEVISNSDSMVSAIEKCPDKNAKAEFSLSIEVIKKMKKDAYESFATMRAKNLRTNKSPESPKYTTFKPKEEVKRVIKRGTASEVGVAVPRTERSPIHIEIEAPSAESEEEVGSENNSIIYQQDLGSIDSRSKKPYTRDISKLKSELHSQRREEKWSGYDEHLTRYKSELESMTVEIVTYKDRNRALERRERDLTNQLKDLKDQVEKGRIRVSSAESSLFEMKIALQEKENAVKALQDELKSSKDLIEDLKISVATQEKRAELKETNFKEQLSKMTEKYQQSENERQSATYELNNMLSQLENIEKKNQQNNKEKDRAYLEEKNKLAKKIESLNSEVSKLIEENEELKMRIADAHAMSSLNNKSKD